MAQTYKQVAVEALTKKELVQVLEAAGVTEVDQTLNKAQLAELIMSNECEVPVLSEDGSVSFVSEEEMKVEEDARLAAEQAEADKAVADAEEARLAQEAADLAAAEANLTEVKLNARYNGHIYVAGQKYNLSPAEKKDLQDAGVL